MTIFESAKPGDKFVARDGEVWEFVRLVDAGDLWDDAYYCVLKNVVDGCETAFARNGNFYAHNERHSGDIIRPLNELPDIRAHHVGESDYSTRKIQPWDIWLEYELNPWDADIIKRVLRNKPGQRRLDYEKIKHICDERMRQLDLEDRDE